MAEGGSDHHRDLPTVSTDGNSLYSHLLECPICLEQLRQPKSLPCLHCFCQECLSTFIMKDLSGQATQSYFSCPVCRRTAYPVDPSEEKENWVKQLPTYSLIHDLIQQQKKNHNPLYCKPCGNKGNMDTPAQVWCKSLNLPFCEACKVRHHDVIHNDCNSLVIAGTDETVLQQEPAVVRCSKHKEKIDYYCKDHREIGCSKCIIGDHRHCEIVTTEEYREKLKTSSREKNLLESLQEGINTIEALMQECGEQMNRLKVTSQKCDILKTAIINTVESINAASKKDDILELLLLHQRGEMEVETCKGFVTETRTTLTPVSFKHAAQQDTALNLGKIVIEKQAGQRSCGTQTLSKCRVKKIEKFCIRCPSSTEECQVKGIVYLPGNYIVIGDYNNRKLKLYTDKGQYLTELQFEGCPNDMCVVNNNTAAVAFENPGSVQVVSVQFSKMSLLFSIKSPRSYVAYGIPDGIGHDCFGITHIDGEFVVSVKPRVYKMTADGKSKLLPKLSDSSYRLTSDPKNGYIYASQMAKTTVETAVYRLSGNKWTEIMKTGVVRGACGVDVDKEGNVYLCGSESNNVVQISSDGTNVRELLTSSDGVNQPMAIAICGDKFTLTNLGNQKDYVHVYSLY